MTERIGYLEGLRGVAAFSVVFAHLFCLLLPVLYFGIVGWKGYHGVEHLGEIELFVKWSPLNLLYNGQVAVIIFFILSGYVLTYKFFKDQDKERIFSSAFRRYPRLMIPVLFSLLAMFFVYKLGWLYNISAASVTGSSWLGTFIFTNVDALKVIYDGFVGVFLFNNPSILTPLWTMTIEFLGSFMVFILALTIGKQKYRWLIYFSALFFLLNSPFICFIIGMIYADMNNSPGNRRYKIDNSPSVMAIFVLGLLFASYRDGESYLSFIRVVTPVNFIDLEWLYQTLGVSLIILSLLNSRFLQSLLSTRIPRFLGRISFSVYITHFIILLSLSSWLVVQFQPKMSYPLMVLLDISISLLFIVLVGYVVTVLVDEPAQAFSRWLYNSYKCKKNVDLYQGILSIVTYYAKLLK